MNSCSIILLIRNRSEAISRCRETSQFGLHLCRHVLDIFLIVLTQFQLILIPTKSTIAFMEQSINQIIALKQFLLALKPIYEALAGAQTTLMAGIREASLGHAYGSHIAESLTRTAHRRIPIPSSSLSTRSSMKIHNSQNAHSN